MTIRSDFRYNQAFPQSLVPLVRTATAASAVIDTQNFSEAGAIFHIGANGITFSTTNKIEVFLQHSDTTTSGDFVDVPATSHTNQVAGGAAGMFASIVANADANQNYRTAYLGTKRYIRVNVVYSGTHGTGTSVAVTGVQAGAQYAPV